MNFVTKSNIAIIAALLLIAAGCGQRVGLTPIEQKEVDLMIEECIKEGGGAKEIIPGYLMVQNYCRENDEQSHDDETILKYVKYFVSQGAEVNTVFGSGKTTPLHEAYKLGYKSIIDFLIAKGADVNAKDNEGRIPSDVPKTIRGIRNLPVFPDPPQPIDFPELPPPPQF